MERFKIASHSVGKRLRDIRKQKGVKSADLLAELMCQKYSPSGILRREEGKLKIDSTYLELFCIALQLDGKERNDILTIARIDLWRSQRSMVELVKEFHQLQSSAENIFSYVVNFIPGQLQTYEYAKAVIGRYKTGDTIEEEARIRVCENAKLLKNTTKKIKICFAYSAMYFPVGSRDVMIEQLSRIRDFADTDNLEIRILPQIDFLAVSDQESMLIFDDKFAFFEVRVGMVTAEDKSMVSDLCSNFETIWTHSVFGEERNKLIDKAIEYYRSLLETNAENICVLPSVVS